MPKYDVCIIDPASTEFNRGSFCYLPYLYYIGCKAMGLKTCIIEDFTVAKIDYLPPASDYYIALWSYPQVDACMVLNKFLPGRFSFFGYYPMIENLKLPMHRVPDSIIELGMEYYPEHYKNFQTILLSDCDMHLVKYKGQVYPLFTSYGCPRGCAFCPSTVNTKRKRIVLTIESIKTMLSNCWDIGIRNIHFTDEDFFFDIERTAAILDWCVMTDRKFNFIALGEAVHVLAFINKYGHKLLEEGGVKIIEVGLETANVALGKKMGKAPVHMCEKIADRLKGTDVDIFWLTLTFFPGETLKSIRDTGTFVKQWGLQLEEVYGRIRTNGTWAGLGQFFQPYEGTKGFEGLKRKGMIISDRPIRLLPSFIPNSFLDGKVHLTEDLKPHHNKWFDLYKVPVPDTSNFKGQRVRYFIESSDLNPGDVATQFAILARLGVI